MLPAAAAMNANGDPRPAGVTLDALRQALRLGHNYVGTEHILLALLELEDKTGVLSAHGIDKERSEAHISAALAAAQESARDA